MREITWHPGLSTYNITAVVRWIRYINQLQHCWTTCYSE
jgi:hypothetical protein